MTVRILTDMPDAEVHRCDSALALPREIISPRKTSRISGRALFVGATIALHVAFIAAMISVEKFRFRPYEVDGVAQAAQVLIPVGFDPPA